MNTKKWYKSKTLWLNLIAVILATVEGTTQALDGVLPASAKATIFGVVGILNLVLRGMTDQKLVK